MKLNFLCAHHKHWLQQNPSAALTTCLQSYETGLDLAEESQFSKALSHAGCALEAAQILMRSVNDDTNEYLRLYCNAAELLVRVLLELREPRQALAIHDAVLLFLETVIMRKKAKKEVLRLSSAWLDLREELGLAPLLPFVSSTAGAAAQLH